ncbi:hypothetical protein [Pseudomonas frederiksbergensis]|uniref:Uncharacterized protein n=1 Tax=Pseudomonas frederiksbergensis TaxID=104087 RepID=A0A423K7M7_9PSED|nr:hypothetical protein [Pseudomonas frederiksbergensis]RON47692.1 hypothetical protein BK665_25415 [Pseudomonas frederiksbergensis]
MGKPSDTSNTPGILRLDFPAIPGLVTPIRPADLAHGGVPLSIADPVDGSGMACVIDPWPDSRAFGALAVGDRVDLYVNTIPFPVDGHTILRGEEDMRIFLYVPPRTLVNGVNEIYYKVTRISNNSDQSDPLKVLCYRPGPTNPRLVLPQDVLRDGVSAARAAQGVICECHYSTPHPYDMVYLTGNSANVNQSVAAGQNSPIVFTLDTNFFRQAGDNPAAPFYFTVFDQLGNRAQSPIVEIDIHLDRVDLDLKEPTVLEARELNGTGINFDRDFYYANFATVRVNYTGSAPGQSVKVYCVGRNHTYGSQIQSVQVAGQTLTFLVPRMEVVDSIGKSMRFYYTVRLPGETQDRPSRDLNVDVSPQEHQLIAPTINEAKNNIRAYHENLIGRYSVRLRLTNAENHDDVRDSDEFSIAPDATYTNLAILQAWITQYRGRDVIFNYTLRKTGTGENIIFSWILRVRL